MIYRGQAFSLSYALAPPPPLPSPVSQLSLFLSLPMCRRSSLLRGRGCGRSQVTRLREKSLVHFKLFNTLWVGGWTNNIEKRKPGSVAKISLKIIKEAVIACIYMQHRTKFSLNRKFCLNTSITQRSLYLIPFLLSSKNGRDPPPPQPPSKNRSCLKT
jgi:hypothetical protein